MRNSAVTLVLFTSLFILVSLVIIAYFCVRWFTDIITYMLCRVSCRNN